MGEMVSFPSNGGTSEGYIARPGGGQAKGVIVIQEWWGLNDNIKGIADRFAGEGFVALAPDMYHGKLTTEPDEAGKMLMALDMERAGKDLKGAIAYLKAQTGGPVGTVGFCMGGALSLFAACNEDGNVGACVDFYGGHPAVKFNWDGLTAPVLAFWAEHDDFVNPNIPAWEEEMKKRGVKYEAVVYPGTAHAFFNDEGSAYDAGAAGKAWTKTLEFYRANL
jgi:carboxymethylenebutenolidase